MQEFFTNYHLPSLLKASWQAAVLILLVLAAQRAFGRRLGPRWRYALWLLVIIRLAVPLTIPSSVSLFNVVRVPKTAAPALVKPAAEVLWATDRARPATVVQAEAAAPVAAATPQPRGLTFHWSLAWLLPVWAAGALALGVFLALSHYRVLRRVMPCR